MLAPSVRTLLDLTRFISPWSRLACPTQPRPPHPHPRSLRRTIAPLLGPECATDTAIPNFGKVEYFCEEGLTGCGVFAPTGNKDRLPDVKPQNGEASAPAWPL